MQSPVGDFAPVAGGPSGSGFMAQTTGKGFTEWGAGMGFDLNNPGDGMGGAGMKSPHDVSGFTGLAFHAKGNVTVRVAVFVMDVTPKEFGGNCEPSSEMGESCDDAHGMSFTLGADWKQYVMPFDKLSQGGWGKPATFDATQAVTVQFQIEAGKEFDVQVDNIGLY